MACGNGFGDGEVESEEATVGAIEMLMEEGTTSKEEGSSGFDGC